MGTVGLGRRVKDQSSTLRFCLFKYLMRMLQGIHQAKLEGAGDEFTCRYFEVSCPWYISMKVLQGVEIETTSSSLGARCWYHRLVTPTEIESRQRKAKQNYGKGHMERTARKTGRRPRERCDKATEGMGGSLREEEGQNGLNIHPGREGAIPFLQRKARRSQESSSVVR